MVTVAERTATVDALLERFQVDRAHARHVADAALAIFDGTGLMHNCGGRARRLLEVGALLHNVGLKLDPPRHQIVGRDVVLGTLIEGLDDDERAIVACLVAFHRKKVRPALEPTFLPLDKKARRTALRLAAILRIADGLDYCGTQATCLLTVDADDNGMRLLISGPRAAEDGARAVEKADLWQKLFGGEVKVEHEPAPDVAPEGQAPVEAVVGEQEPETATLSLVTTTDPLAEAGRVLLRRHFRRFLGEEQDIGAGEDPEAVHQLRVASRRLRAILRLVEPVAPANELRRFTRWVRQAAREAGVVRDSDVFMAQVRTYAEGLPEQERDGLKPLLDALAADRAKGRAQLLDHFGAPRQEEFKRAFAAFMTGPSDGWQMQPRIRDLAGSMLWHHYEQLRAHEAEVDMHNPTVEQSEAIHELRISGKRLRYTLELINEATGLGVDPVLDPLIALQDYVGRLQDISVAVAYVAALDAPAEARPALDAYVAARTAEREGLLAGLPARWEKVMSSTYRRKLMELIVKL